MKHTALVVGLALAWVTPAPVAWARAKHKPLFSKALSWPKAQSKRQIAVARGFCHGLDEKPTRPSRVQRAKPAVPEHPGLRWGLPASKVRWVLARSKTPVRLHCFAKTANAYLTQRRRLSKSVRGGPRTLWTSTLYFRAEAPYGLSNILLMTSSVTKQSQVSAVLKAARALYGVAKTRPAYRNARYQNTWYTWNHGKTRIRLIVTRYLRKQRFDLSIRYSAR